MRTILVYDDSVAAPAAVATLVGRGEFGSIVFRRERLEERTQRIATQLGWDFARITTIDENEALRRRLADARPDRVIWIGSSLAPADEAHAGDCLERFALALGTCRATLAGQATRLVAMSTDEFLGGTPTLAPAVTAADEESRIAVDAGFIDVSELFGLQDFLSGAFAARHFNQVTRTRHEVTKTSRDARKMEAEYSFHGLLPESMRRWFVAPSGFARSDDGASYSMERLLVLDMGQQWVNGSFSPPEFGRFLEDIFCYLDNRSRRSCSAAVARQHFDRLYVDKLQKRVAAFREIPWSSRIDALLVQRTRFGSLATLVECYLDLAGTAARSLPDFECVSHGDCCFSNILYDRRIRLLKLIDPGGALTEAELYSDPSYDLAKLSHSVLGGYDYIVNGLYEISVDARLDLRLHTPDTRHDAFARLFVDGLEQRGIDVGRIRLFEASLFLSMLPLHSDQPRNVLAFVLVAAHILDEILGQRDL